MRPETHCTWKERLIQSITKHKHPLLFSMLSFHQWNSMYPFCKRGTSTPPSRWRNWWRWGGGAPSPREWHLNTGREQQRRRRKKRKVLKFFFSCRRLLLLFLLRLPKMNWLFRFKKVHGWNTKRSSSIRPWIVRENPTTVWSNRGGGGGGEGLLCHSD